ncbi:MAG: Hpt domain-containing protein [Dongiaceae bacterium]
MPVDLTNFRDMISGDKELEKVLFHEFFAAFEKGIENLRANDGDNPEAWRLQAHALKGTALNLGAQALSDFCRKAQEKHTAAAEEKRRVLKEIEQEYKTVKEFLLAELAGS